MKLAQIFLIGKTKNDHKQFIKNTTLLHIKLILKTQI